MIESETGLETSYTLDFEVLPLEQEEKEEPQEDDEEEELEEKEEEISNTALNNYFNKLKNK